jgi:hypothetical protein
MDSGSASTSLDEVLQASPKKTNFLRLTRLLICGGTKVVRELFDSIIAPEDLANTLNDPPVLSRLQDMRNKKLLTHSQWQILFPLPGTLVESKSFDLTLLFKLLREICSLMPPLHTGWDNLPNSTDTSLEADLARIKHYRNQSAHANERLEVCDDDFKVCWDEIKAALIRIITSTAQTDAAALECEKVIDNLLTASLTNNDVVQVKEMLGYSG